MWSAATLLATTLLAVLLTSAHAQTPSDLEARCARLSFAFFANEADCGRFLFCNDGVPMELDCRADEIWRQQDGACVLGNRDTCTVWEPEEACVGLGNGPIVYPGHCERYIDCVEERANVNYCPVGHIFSEKEQRCIIGSTISCESYEHLCELGPYSRFRHPEICESFIQCYNQKVNLYSCGYKEIFLPNVGNCVVGENCEPLPVNEVCVGRYDGIVAHPEDCGSYIECEEGKHTVTTCPEGEIFRDELCVPGARATCQTLDGMCAIREDYEQLEHPDGCGLYVECIRGQAEVEFCPVNKIFRPDMQFCIPGDATTCKATPIAEMCANSPYGVIFPHPNDCSQLIRCDGSNALEKPCPEHHIVQPGSLNCVPGLYETCKSFDEICQGQFDNRITHPSCDKFVYCQNEKALVLSCAPGEIYFEEEQKCIPGDSELCEALTCTTRPDGLNPHPNLCHGFYQCSNEQISSHLCPIGHIFDPSASVCTPGDIQSCQPDPLETMCEKKFDGVRYPHPDGFDCLRFVTCQSGEAVIESCPAGAVLRPQFLDCVPGDAESCEVFTDICPEESNTVLPHPGRCDVKIVCEMGSPSVESCPEGEIVNWDTLECVPGGINDCFPVENMCEGRENGLLEDPSSCTRYIRCESEQMTVWECTTGKVFLEELQACVPGDAQACTNICTGQENGLALENPSSCVEYYRCSEGLPIVESCDTGNIFVETTCVPGSADSCEDFSDRCIDQPDGRLAYPDTNQCTQYLECFAEITSVGSCQEGTVFVAELGQCAPGDATACTNICTGQENGLAFENPSSCVEYYRCSEGLPITASCDTGNIFVETTCVPGSADSCEDFSDRCIDQPDGRLAYPDTNQCTQYLECFAEITSVGSCQEGTVFVAELGQCAPGDATACTNICTGQEDGSLLPNLESCVDYFRCTDELPIAETCDSEHIFDEFSERCVPGSADSCEDFSKRCAGQPDGLIPIPDSARCNQFLACSDESVSLGSCPEGEMFSEAVQLCVPGDAEQCLEDADYNFCEGLEDGSYAHPQVCYLFVRCQVGSAQVEACRSDEVFNAESGTCETGDRTSC